MSLRPQAWESIAAPAIRVEPPGPESRAILDRIAAAAYPGLTAGLAPFALAEKRAWTVTDADGNVYLDLASASASVPLGAGRPELFGPVVEALETFGNEDSHALASELTAELGERLLAITPSSVSRFDLALNGTEAVEIAIKMMRRATGRPVIIGFHGSYHGESTTTAALGAEASEISRGLRGLVPGFAHVPYPNPYRTPLREPRPGGSGDATVDYLRDQVLFHALDPGEVAGVVIEPVLGSGGCVAPPQSFWSALVELCTEHGWLLCADEVKTGMGRSGHLFAIERWGLEPDLICLGKALGGGVMPIGAVLGSERAMGTFDDVPTGSTWSWLPAACAAALATIDLFEREPVLENVRELERLASDRLAELRGRFERIGDVRAVGCFIAIEFVTDRTTIARDHALQDAVAAQMLRRGVIADSSTTSLNLQPSLVMPAEALEQRPRDRRRVDRGGARRAAMSELEAELLGELDSMARAGTLKRIPVLRSPQGSVVELEGRGEVLCLCSNDYLGLANHPEVVAAAIDGLTRYGAGTASVRFICGKFAPHVALEGDLAEFLETEAAITYGSCWNANAALLDALCDKRTAVFSDRLNHASIIDGMRLARPGHKAVYEHADVVDLRRALEACPPGIERRLIVTDGVFSMEGDLAPITKLAELAADAAATLIVDDSHGLGVIGERGRGVLERFGLLGRAGIVVTGTLGKALGGAAGGFVAGGAGLCGALEQSSRAQLFSNGLAPSVACSARRALAELRDRPQLLARLHDNVASMRRALAGVGLEPLPGESAIVPIIIGDTAEAIRISEALLERGVYVTGFGYPVVPEGTARIRLQLSAALEPSQLDAAAAAIAAVAAPDDA